MKFVLGVFSDMILFEMQMSCDLIQNSQISMKLTADWV